MSSSIYIFGHKNPDADAICSAIAYEAYKRATGSTEYIAARCGNTNGRIDAILDHFDLPLPRFIGDVTPRVENIMRTKVRSINKDSTCAEALELIDKYDVRTLPVVDNDGHLEGLISIFQLGEFFIPKPNEPRKMRRVHTNIKAIIRSLNAKVIHETNSDAVEELFVRIGAMDINSLNEDSEHDEGISADSSVIVVGDRRDIQKRCLELGIRLLVITGNLEVDEDIIKHAKECNVSLIVSPYDSASTSWMIRTAMHIEGLIETDVKCFTTQDRVELVKRRIPNLNAPLYMVTNGSRELIGVFSKSDILRSSNTRIALVDHNELEQAVNGADKVEITEIIDHHRLGNKPTNQPILFINRPVGSTCSIIADLYRTQSLTPEPKIAGILMAGIISDTLFLNSPTATGLEKELLEWLEPIANTKSEKLAKLIFSSGSIILNQTPEEVIASDCKNYTEGGITFSVSQIEELGFDNFWKYRDALDKALKDYWEKENMFFSLLFVTDINSHDSLLVVASDHEFQEQISYPQHGKSNIYDLPGVVSRKKQLIPYLSTLLKTMGVVE
ncbi:MAG: manganese-dependent inorganic pyrophosphatase [Lentimonas sp.]|jgi:manganese-dependent inorganic pyrophosphatase